MQARLGSTRLPNKVFKNLGGKPVLEHVMDRLKNVRNVDGIIIATTDDKNDDPIVEWSKQNNYDYYRGSQNDVLSRFFHASKKFDLDIIVRITSDCPFIDPDVCSQAIEMFLTSNFDMVTNGGPDLNLRTYPRGMDVSVFSSTVLDEAYLRAVTRSEREHVTPYMYAHKNVGYLQDKVDNSRFRLTLDTHEDLELLREIQKHVGDNASYKEIVELLEKRKYLTAINEMIVQKTE